MDSPAPSAARRRTGRGPRPRRSREIEAIEVHDLRPSGHEIAHELLLGVFAGVDLGASPQLRARTEDEIDAGARPTDLSRVAVGTPHRPPRRPTSSTPSPCRAGSRRSRWSAPRTVGEDPVRGSIVVGAEDAQAADEHRHLGRGQRQATAPDRPAGAPPGVLPARIIGSAQEIVQPYPCTIGQSSRRGVEDRRRPRSLLDGRWDSRGRRKVVLRGQ